MNRQNAKVAKKDSFLSVFSVPPWLDITQAAYSTVSVSSCFSFSREKGTHTTGRASSIVDEPSFIPRGHGLDRRQIEVLEQPFCLRGGQPSGLDFCEQVSQRAASQFHRGVRLNILVR